MLNLSRRPTLPSMKWMVGRLLQLAGAPGFVRPIEYTDQVTGQRVKVRTSPRYTIVSVDSLELFFIRESGRFDGIGAMSLDDPTRINHCTAERIQRLAGARAGDVARLRPE